jgi:hypothetical protein
VGQEKEMELKMVRECAIPPPFSFEKEVKSKSYMFIISLHTYPVGLLLFYSLMLVIINRCG